MEHIFVINPVSGTANAQTFLQPAIEKAAKELSISYQIIQTEHPGHGKEIAERFSKTGKPVRFYACGGDGTLNEVLEGTLGHANAETACVPCGSGNDFIRNFGSKEEFLDLKNLILGESCTIDLIRTQYGIAAAICSAGLDAQVAYGIPKFRRIPFAGGETAYKLSILTSLCSKLGHKLRIQADGEVFTGEYLMLAICNGRTYGGGFQAAPQADLQDGLLDLILVKKLSRLRIAGVVSTYQKGDHLKDGKVIPELQNVMTYRRVKSVDVEVLDHRPIIVTQDGECAPRMGLHAKVETNAVRVTLPQSVCNRSRRLPEGRGMGLCPEDGAAICR